MEKIVASPSEPLTPIDLTEVLKDYVNKWVVLSNDKRRVLSAANELKDIKDSIPQGIVLYVSDPKVINVF